VAAIVRGDGCCLVPAGGADRGCLVGPLGGAVVRVSVVVGSYAGAWLLGLVFGYVFGVIVKGVRP